MQTTGLPGTYHYKSGQESITGGGRFSFHCLLFLFLFSMLRPEKQFPQAGLTELHHALFCDILTRS